MTLSEKLSEIRQRMADATLRAGRSVESVQLLAVSKTFPVEAIEEAFAAGQLAFGENKVQEALEKIPQLPSALQWHLIGPLQRNKVRKALPHFSMIHAVDSVRLAETISQVAAELNIKAQILLEVNVDGEERKFGFMPEQLREQMLHLAALPSLEIKGLMCIPKPQETPDKMRPAFRRLRELARDLKETYHLSLPELSMGMSDDFEVAIEEGSTIIRVGSALFGHR